MFVCAINRHILEEMTLVCCGSQCLLLCVNCGLLIRQETFWVESFLSCPHSCENEASCCYNPFWHFFLPVSQGLQAKRLKELHCRHSKETVALFAKDAALSRQVIGLKEQGWDSGCCSKESGERVKWKGRWMMCVLLVLRAADLYLKHVLCEGRSHWRKIKYWERSEASHTRST